MSNVTGLDPSIARTYVPLCDRDLPEDEQCKFYIRLLRAREAAGLRDEIYRITGMGKNRKETLRSGSHELQILYKCLEGWENFNDDKDKPIEFDKRKGKEGYIIDNVDYISDDIRSELARFASRENEVSEDEEGNLDTQSDGPSGADLDS